MIDNGSNASAVYCAEWENLVTNNPRYLLKIFFRPFHAPLVLVTDSKKGTCDDEFDDHVINETSRNFVKVYSFQPILVREDAS